MKERNHAQKRALERYGLDLTMRDLVAITHAIQNNEGKLIEHYKDTGKSLWSLTYNDVPMRLVMSADLWKVITFVPLHRRSRKETFVVYRKGRPEYIRKRA